MNSKQTWEQMELFKGIDLHDSFVLSWSFNKVEISFELEVSIWPESTYYSKPKEDDYTCYKPGLLKFRGFENTRGILSMSEVKPSKDADGSIDFGNIEYFSKTNNQFEIHGDFGKVVISGGEFSFDISA